MELCPLDPQSLPPLIIYPGAAPATGSVWSGWSTLRNNLRGKVNPPWKGKKGPNITKNSSSTPHPPQKKCPKPHFHTYVTKVIPNRWCPRGGSMGIPSEKQLSQQKVVMNATLYILHLKESYSSKKILKIIYRFKMAAEITDFCFVSVRFWRKFKKKHFSKKFFNEIIWLITRDCQYIYITEIEIGHFYSWWILGATFFATPTPQKKKW